MWKRILIKGGIILAEILVVEFILTLGEVYGDAKRDALRRVRRKYGLRKQKSDGTGTNGNGRLRF